MPDTFDLYALLPAHTSSIHTQRAYYRWIDRYLVDLARVKPASGDARIQRMMKLPLKTLNRYLQPRALERWLQALVTEGHGRQGLDQARAAIVTLAELMAQAGMLESENAARIKAVSVPSIPRQPAPERLLTPDEIKQLMNAARDMGQSPQQMLRNHVVVTLLCTLALRREELSAAKWGDVTLVNNKPVLRIDNDTIELPRPTLALLDRWRATIESFQGDPSPQTPLVRRIWKGGRIGKPGLSPDGVWLIIRDAAIFAGLEHVAPDDLRRSVVAGLRDAGVSIDDISRLLRHRSRLVTERFLAKLPETETEE